MKNIFLFISMLMILSACEDLEQTPPNIASSSSLTEYGEVLNAAYHYHNESCTPMAIFGDFRSDNCRFDESPHDNFDSFNGDLITMEGDFFQPFYAGLYRSILSANIVIEGSDDLTEVAEAQFVRALAYFKLVKVFGGVTINLDDAPSTSDQSILVRSSVAEVYAQIITDLDDAIAVLDNTQMSSNRASEVAAQGLLGKVYMQMKNYSDAETVLEAAISGAAGAGISLQTNYADVFSSEWNEEILFSTGLSSSIEIDLYSDDNFTVWYGGGNTKADEIPVNMDLIDAFDVAGDTVRKAYSIDTVNQYGTKYAGAADQDWIELRLADVILLYAEALNENGTAAATVLPLLDDIRTRAGLTSLTGTITSQDDVREAIATERRLELAFEGQRWFDLVRTGTVDAEMGETINSDYYLFPIPDSEVQSSNGIITQNSGY